jgi:hypothetical protein
MPDAIITLFFSFKIDAFTTKVAASKNTFGSMYEDE